MGCEWSKPKKVDKVDPGENEKDRTKTAFNDDSTDDNVRNKTVFDVRQSERNSREQSRSVSAKSTILQRTVSRKYSKTSSRNNEQDDIVSVSNTSLVDSTINILPDSANNHVEIVDADLQAFNRAFSHERENATNKQSLSRSLIQSWKPSSLQELTEFIEKFSQEKSVVDCHWIIFYWIVHNISYDTMSYFSKNYADQTAEGVFRNKRGVCAGYANLYKYLCDHLQLPCEIINGYAKGHGFQFGDDAPAETDHAWNAVQIDGHWYLLDSTWGAGHLNKQHSFEKKLNCFYFLTRPSHMIYDHLPEKDKWQLLQTPITMTQYLQMPKTHSTFFDLNLDIIHPRHQAHLTLVQNQSYASVHIRAPTDVILIACLTNDDGQKIEGGEQVYFNEKKSIWQCKFAPNGTGSFVASIYAKKSSDVGSYPEAVSFQLKVNNLPLQPISFPKTEQIFYDLNLKIIAPKNSVNVPWPKNASYVEVLISAPDYVQLSCQMQYNNSYVENGSITQFDIDKHLWQLLFVPQNTGKHELIVFAKRTDQEESTFAVELHLYVTELRNKMEFPHIYGKFHTNQCRIYEPLNGILKKGAQVPIHCFIPGAIAVDVQIDSVWAKTKSYQDPTFKETITVGSKDVIIYARYNQGNSYSALAKYSVR